MNKPVNELTTKLAEKWYPVDETRTREGAVLQSAKQAAFHNGIRAFVPEYNKTIIEKLESALKNIKHYKAGAPNFEMWVYDCRDVEGEIFKIIKELK